MSMETNGTTNGAPKGKNNTSLTILAGDFLILMQDQEIGDKSKAGEPRASEFKSLREDDSTLSILLELDTNKDVTYKEFIEQNPNLAEAKMTKEEWEKLLMDYLKSKQAKNVDNIDKN